MLLNLLTKFAGFFFLAIAASTLGADRSSDIFFAANSIPELISNVILFGAISVSVVPVLIDVLSRSGEKVFLRVLNSVLNISVLIFTILGILLAIFAKDIFPYFLQNVINPVTPYSAEEIKMIIDMTRVLLIPQIILGVSTFITSALYAKNRIVMPQIAPLFYNFGRIVGTVIFIPILGFGAWGLVWATLIGSVFHLLVQIPLAVGLKIKYLLVLETANRHVRKIVTLGLPRIVSLATEYIAITVDQFIALGLVAGSATTYFFAVRLVSIPLALFGTTFAIATFPALSKAFSTKDMKKFSDLLHSSMRYIFYLAAPTSILFLVLKLPFVRLTFGLFDRGTLDLHGTQMIAWIVLFFSLGLAFESLRTILYRAFYAVHDSFRPFFASIFVVVFGIITGILFTNYFSHFDEFRPVALLQDFNFDYFFEKSVGKAAVGGLALSSSLTFSIEFFILIILTNAHVVKIRFKSLATSLGKKLIAATVMGIVLLSLFRLWEFVLDDERTLNLFILTIVTSFSGIMTYIWVSYIIRDEDVGLILKLTRRIGRLLKTSKNSNRVN